MRPDLLESRAFYRAGEVVGVAFCRYCLVLPCKEVTWSCAWIGCYGGDEYISDCVSVLLKFYLLVL